jgi:hypothetical protein
MGSHSARKVNKEDFMKLQTAKTMLQYAKQYMDLGQLRVVQTDEDWVYIPSHKAIGVAEYTPQDEIEWEEWMIGYIKDTFDYDITLDQMEIFSLFHELGHHMNGWICTNEEYNMLVQEIDDDDNYGYRQIPDEKAADEFAINFLREHMDNLLELNK